MQPHTLQDFEFHASPPSWYEVAKLLNEQATVLHRDKSTLIQRTDQNGTSCTRFGTNRGVFLLAGFSVENIIKAFLIYENPTYIAHGKLSAQLRTHRLSKLWEASSYVPYKRRYASVVATLEDGLESWARYPCGLTQERAAFELVMTDAIWQSYNVMFLACGRRLERLLSKGFKGPDGHQSFMRYDVRA